MACKRRSLPASRVQTPGVGAVHGRWMRQPRHAAWLGTQPATAHGAALPTAPTPLY